MASETVSSSRAEKQQPEAKKSSTKNIIVYALIAVGGVVLCGIAYWGWRKHSSPSTGGAPSKPVLTPIKFPESSDTKCDYYTLYEIKSESPVNTNVKTPKDTLSALTSNNFESFKVINRCTAVGPTFSIVLSDREDYEDIYPYDTLLTPYRIKWDQSKPYYNSVRYYSLRVIRWETVEATTFTVFNYLTKEMRDYQFKKRDVVSIRLIPSLNAAVTQTFGAGLVEIIDLKEGKRVFEGSASDPTYHVPDSEYFIKKDSNGKNRISTLVDGKMTSLGTIDDNTSPQHHSVSSIYVEPKCCAFIARTPLKDSTDLIIDRYLYNKATEHFDDISPVSIKAVIAKDETLTAATPELIHVGTDTAKETFKFVLTFNTSTSALLRVTLLNVPVSIKNSDYITPSTPYLRGLAVLNSDIISYEDIAGKGVEIFRRKSA